MSLTISSTVKRYPKQLPYQQIAHAILGPDYTVSLTFIGSTRAQTLNQTYRHKSYVPNVLSFPLSEDAGEVYICPEVARREAHSFNLTPDSYLAYLFIHGCLHLTGLEHGPVMDKLEQQYCKKFKLK